MGSNKPKKQSYQNLKQHLEDYHIEDFKQYTSDKEIQRANKATKDKSIKITNYFLKETKNVDNIKDQVTENIGMMIFVDMQPLSKAKDIAFQNHFKTILPDYQIQSDKFY
ncbi:hypothetical protein ABPG72_001048 [Tetrahymena utriculariae]